MHYSIELWANYNKVYQQINKNLEGLKDLIGIFTERYKTNQYLANTLTKLSESKNNITTFESLLEGILGFKGDMFNQYNYLSEFLVGLRDEIIKPLSLNYQTFVQKLNKNFNETSTFNKAYQSAINQMEVGKNQFHSSVYSAEQSKLKAEYYKQKINNLNKKESKDNYTNLLKQEEMKAMSLLKESKENERIYINLINNANRIQEEYIEIKKRNLNQIQDLEEEIGEYIKDSLRKFIIFQVAYLRNMQYDVDKKAKIIEGINIRNDIQKFIKENKSNNIPPEKFEYIPYISKLGSNNEKKEIQNISPEISKEVNNFISNVFPKERAEEVKLFKTKMQVDIVEIIKKLYSEEKLNFEDNKEITKIIMNKRARRLLLKELNNYSIKDNNSLLNDKAYDTINEIIKESLKLIIPEKDFKTAELIINLSSTLYKNSNDEEQTQIFIISDIKHEKTIKSYEFWKEFIKHNIIEEIHNQKIMNVNLEKEEKKKKENIKINDIVLNKLNIFTKYMIDFCCRPKFIRQIIEEFKEFYQLSDKDIEELNKIIDNYENEQINKNNISTYSTEQNSSNVK